MEPAVHTKEEILQRLRRLAPELRMLGVERIGLFGSFLRGEPHEWSDVDLPVEFAPGRKNFDNFMQLAYRLEDVLKRRVELVTKESLSPHIGPRILEEMDYVSSPVEDLRHILDEASYLIEKLSRRRLTVCPQSPETMVLKMPNLASRYRSESTR